MSWRHLQRRSVVAATVASIMALQAPGVAAQDSAGWNPKLRERARTNGERPVPHVSAARLARSGTDSANWLSFGHDHSNQRWSAARDINTTNVRELQVAWLFQTGNPRGGSFQTSPIVADGVMYLTAPYSVVIALDAVTGRTRWRYEPKLRRSSLCCGPNNRGVAIADSSVFVGTLDARLIALDARNGRVEWDAEIADPDSGFSVTMAPLVVGDLVIVGVAGSEYGIRGRVTAYDRRTGRRRWIWYTIPERGWEGVWAKTAPGGEDLHRDIAKEKRDSARFADAWRAGGGGVWMTPAYDAQENLLYFTVGNPAPDFDGSERPGDNLYSNSIVALNASTGEYRWHFQEVPHDLWDLDPASPVVVTRLPNGQKAVVEAGKTGWVYVLDAKTGTLIRRSQPFVRQRNMFAKPTAEGTLIGPGSNGGSEWSPPAIDVRRGIMYVFGVEQEEVYQATDPRRPENGMWLGGQLQPVIDPPATGNITAINLSSGRIAWQTPRELPMVGGGLATAGGLLFAGEGNGFFRAYNASTGKVLWSFQAGAGCNAPPITFIAEGRQYVSIACGGNNLFGFPLGNTLVTFALPVQREARSSR